MDKSNTPLDSWFLKVLANHWRVFGKKKYYKHFAQKGHTWVRLPSSIWASNARKRHYKCESCGTIMNIILMTGRLKASIFYKRNNPTLSCEQLRMDEALK